MRINKIIERRQTCDMGSGFGKFEFDEDITLKEFLEYYKENNKTWGIVIIRKRNGRVLRCFDFDIYSKDVFYCHLPNWDLEDKVKKATFTYCFMQEEIEITLK